MLEIVTRANDRPPLGAEAALSLTWEMRQRSRQMVRLDDGRPAALMLPRGSSLKDGDLLLTLEGELVRVVASQEELSRVSCPDPLALAKACYHLGNRHVPVQIMADGALYQRDHVLDDMLSGLGLTISPVVAAFQPEPGAYHGHHGRP